MSAPSSTGGAEPPMYMPDGVTLAIRSEDCPPGTPIVAGHDFDSTPKGVDFDAMMASFKHMGFQATNLGLAIDEVNKMLSWRLSDEPLSSLESAESSPPELRAATKCTIFLSFTSNQISSGQREIIRYLVKHRLVSCLVTTAGAIEEDIMKTLRPHYIGAFDLKGKDLRLRGINRTGNLLVPNLNYSAFEEWMAPLIDAMHDEQVRIMGRDEDEAAERAEKAAAAGGAGAAAKGGAGGGGAASAAAAAAPSAASAASSPKRRRVLWSPSRIIRRMGLEVKDESSVLHWAAVNDIPVFCPGLTDGAVGDLIFWHTFKREGFILDVAQDVFRLSRLAMRAKRSGMIIIGGGIAKHHTCNANLLRNGADYAVYLNTAQEFDGSDSGAKPDEAISWGKIKITATPVKVYADATITFPLLVSQTFVKHQQAAAAAGVDPAVEAAETPSTRDDYY